MANRREVYTYPHEGHGGTYHGLLAAAKISKAIQDVVGWVRPALRPQDTGGVLYMIYRGDPEDLYWVALAGEFARFTPEQSYDIASEKAGRLYYLPQQISSWQSRNPAEKQYGGAIVAGDYILSFSGFSEHGDEAVVLCAASICGLLDDARIKAIVAISENPLFEQCFRLLPPELQESTPSGSHMLICQDCGHAMTLVGTIARCTFCGFHIHV